jgi:hypothetical protein
MRSCPAEDIRNQVRLVRDKEASRQRSRKGQEHRFVSASVYKDYYCHYNEVSSTRCMKYVSLPSASVHQNYKIKISRRTILFSL